MSVPKGFLGNLPEAEKKRLVQGLLAHKAEQPGNHVKVYPTQMEAWEKELYWPSEKEGQK